MTSRAAEPLAFARWRREPIPDGVILTSPRGRAWGSIAICPNRRPLRRLRDVVAELAAEKVARIQPIVPSRRLVTDEGEIAVLAHVRAEADEGLEFDWHVAVIPGEGCFSLVEGGCVLAAARDHFAARFEDLVRCLCLGHAPSRRRMFVYRIPTGWRGLRRPFSTVWLPPSAPRDRSTITVNDASPITGQPSLCEQLFGAPANAELTRRAAIASAAGLHGVLQATPERRASRATIDTALVELRDARFLYRARLETRGDECHMETFLALVDSMEPVPAPAASVPEQPAAEDFHWAL